MTTTHRGRLLIANDEPNMRLALSAILRAEGYLIDTAENGLRAVEHCQQTQHDVIF